MNGGKTTSMVECSRCGYQYDGAAMTVCQVCGAAQGTGGMALPRTKMKLEGRGKMPALIGGMILGLLGLCMCSLISFTTLSPSIGSHTPTARVAQLPPPTATVQAEPIELGTSIPMREPTDTNSPTASPTYTPLSTYTPLPTHTRESTPIPSSTPQPAENVAIGKPSSADSEQASNSVAKGNDGDVKTRWCASDSRLNHWWMVDLGAPYDLIGSQVTWEYDGKLYNYKVEASTDKRDWVIAADQTQNTRTTLVQRDSFTVQGRYVRITVTGLPPAAWASFCEFSVFGMPAPTPTPTPSPTATSTPMPATATAAAQATATAAKKATEAAATAAVQATEAAATAAQATEAAATAAAQAIKATATAYACLNAAFVADVTIPDGTRLDTGTSFVKTWRVKNTGKCDWHQDAVIAFESGDQLDAPLTVQVGALPVGQQVDVSVSMRAPVQAGKYTGVWRMQDGGGRFFGGQLTVKIIAAVTAAAGGGSTPSSSQWSCTEFDAPFRVVWIKGEADVYHGVDQPAPGDVKGHLTGGAGGVEASCSRPGDPTFYRLRGVGWWGWVKASDTGLNIDGQIK